MFLYRPTRSVTGRRLSRVSRRYIVMLSVILMGYALGGRGFAYLGVPPIFIGEITLMLGIWALVNSGQTWRMLRLTYFLPLLCFMAWGAYRSVPYFSVWGFDTVRDAVVWGYGLFAIVTAGVLVAVPERLALLVKFYRRYAVMFLIVTPLLWLVVHSLGGSMPINPMNGSAYIDIKGGDICVQLAGIFVFLATMGDGINPWIGPLFIPLDLALNMEGRAGILSFAVGACLALTLKPFNARIWRVFAVIAICLMLLWTTQFKIENVGGGREISFEFATETVTSIFSSRGSSDQEATKEWRLRWWHDILNYTVHGKYFWTGKGFGINLANDDGYQTDGMLRSPHNGHLTILARAGVPGIVLWAMTQLAFAGPVLFSFLRARRRRDYRWAGLFLCLLTYWAALLTNASFDVFIEGPMGGIWLWSIYGIGIASIIIFRRYPQVLYMPDQSIDV